MSTNLNELRNDLSIYLERKATLERLQIDLGEISKVEETIKNLQEEICYLQHQQDMEMA